MDLAGYREAERKAAAMVALLQIEIRKTRTRRVDHTRLMLKIERNRASALRCLAHQKVVALESEMEFESILERIRQGVESAAVCARQEQIKADLIGLRRVAVL